METIVVFLIIKNGKRSDVGTVVIVSADIWTRNNDNASATMDMVESEWERKISDISST